MSFFWSRASHQKSDIQLFWTMSLPVEVSISHSYCMNCSAGQLFDITTELSDQHGLPRLVFLSGECRVARKLIS